MKKIFLSFLVAIVCKMMIAQVPASFNYQAIVRNTAGEVLGSQTVSFRFSILKGSASGTSVYCEKHAALTNQFGLISVGIGNGTDQTGILSNINWGEDIYFLKTEVDPEGGTSYTDMGTTQILSVPFAMYAKTADFNLLLNKPEINNSQWTTAGNNIYYNLENVGIGILNPTSKLDISGEINLNNNRIINVAAPVNTTDAVTKEYVDALLQKINQLESQPGFFKDYDGNVYLTVKIGNQEWSAENLRTTHYNDGTPVPLVTSDFDWSILTTPGFCWYLNDETNYKNPYGALYNWYAIDTLSNSNKNICPIGWHVPSDEDWNALVSYLGDEYSAGGMLKEAGTTHWQSPNTGATNEFGFTAFPGGFRNQGGSFETLGYRGFWWSDTSFDNAYSWCRFLSFNSTYVSVGQESKHEGLSVRCIKNN